MTCFWDGIIRSLTKEDYAKIGLNLRPNAIKFAEALTAHNTKNTRIMWRVGIKSANQKMGNQFKSECFEARKCLDIKRIRHGYDCSTCDPFLFLVADIFGVNIRHDYMQTSIFYVNELPNITRTLHFASNRGHFYFKNKII